MSVKTVPATDSSVYNLLAANTEMTTTVKLLVGFGVLTLLLVLSSVAIIVRVRSIQARAAETETTRRIYAESGDLEINVLDYALEVRTFLSTREPQSHNDAIRAADNVESHLKEYERLAVTDRQREMATRFGTMWLEMRQIGQTLLAAEKGPAARADLDRFYTRRVALEKFLDDEIRSESYRNFTNSRDTTLEDVEDIVRFAVILLIVGFVIALSTSIAVGTAVVGSERSLRASEERKSGAFEAALDCIITINHEGIITEFNRAAEATFGHRREDMIGRELAETIIPHKYRERHLEGMARYLETGQEQILGQRLELSALRSDGTEFPVELTVTRIQTGSRPLFTAFLRDITDRKLADKTIRESQERFATAFNSSPLAITITSLKTGKLVEVNDTFVTITGYDRADAIGRTTAELGLWQNSSDRESELLSVVRDGKIRDLEYRFRMKDGSEIVGLLSAEVLDLGGEACALTVIQDITARKYAEEALKKSEELFSRFMQHLPGLAWIKDTEGRYVYANDAAETAFQTPRAKLYGRTDDEIFPPEISSQFRKNDDIGLEKTGGLQTVETLKHEDGVLHHSIVSKFPISDPEKGLQMIGGMAIDITERILAETALRESEERRQLAQEAGNVGIFDWDIIENKTYWSENMWAFYDENPREVNPDDGFWSRHIHKSDRARVKANIRNVVSTQTADEFRDEFRVVGKAGAVRWIEAVAKVSRDASGQAVRMYGVNLDITHRKAIEERIRISENQLRLVTDTVPALISYIDTSYTYRFVNQKYSEWFGAEREEIIGSKIEDVVGAEAFSAVKANIQKALSGQEVTFEAELDYTQVGKRFVRVSYVPDLGFDNKVNGFYALISDLSDLKQAQDLLQEAHDELEIRVKERTKELAESNNALVQEMQEREATEKQRIHLLRRLVSSQEFERRRIARDLHDQLGQRLTALRLKLASLHEISGDNEQVASRVLRLQEIAERLDTEVSFLAWELRPSILDDLGLLDAAAAFVDEWSRHYEISAEFHSSGLSKERLDREVETHLYRITQEAMNNIAKHAGAKNVTVLLERRAENVILIIEDDGAGFDPADRRDAGDATGGLGLVGMGERAALVGGKIEIESGPGKGTTIFIRVPFST